MSMTPQKVMEFSLKTCSGTEPCTHKKAHTHRELAHEWCGLFYGYTANAVQRDEDELAWRRGRANAVQRDEDELGKKLVLVTHLKQEYNNHESYRAKALEWRIR